MNRGWRPIHYQSTRPLSDGKYLTHPLDFWSRIGYLDRMTTTPTPTLSIHSHVTAQVLIGYLDMLGLSIAKVANNLGTNALIGSAVFNATELINDPDNEKEYPANSEEEFTETREAVKVALAGLVNDMTALTSILHLARKLRDDMATMNQIGQDSQYESPAFMAELLANELEHD